MRKKISLILILFLLTGCEVNYNLHINENEFEENITSKFNYNKMEPEEQLSLSFINEQSINAFINDDSIKQHSNLAYKGKNAIIDIGYNYDSNNFDAAYSINNCFEEHVFLNEEDYYYIELIGDFGCQYGETVNVNIDTDYAVLETNASKKNNNYYWTLTDKNNKNVDMYIKISKTIEYEDTKKNGLGTFKKVSFIILLILSLVVYLLYRKTNSDSI